MVDTVERGGAKPPVEEPIVKERPTDMEVPPEIEEGMSVTPSQFKAQVTDDQGKPMIQTPQDPAVTIQVPASQQQLDDWTKGNPDNAITWFAVFWIRLIKKALHFGWRMVKKVQGE